MMGEPRCIQPANALLGEGPLWDAEQGVLFWVDIERPAVFRWDPRVGQTGHWPMPASVGCVARTRSGLIVADAEGFALLNVQSGALSRIVNPEPGMKENRFNDGKVDRAGRLWAGTMDRLCTRPTGSLYRLDRDLSVHRMDTGFICANGLGWSPDNRTMYFTDSTIRTIWAYEFDLASGDLGERRAFARMADDDGVPDGLAVDCEGFVWSAVWDGWRLTRFAPDGSIDCEIPLPVQRPTSCAFGGPDLKTLFVTSACADLGCEALATGPLAGALFAMTTDVAGLSAETFGGCEPQ